MPLAVLTDLDPYVSQTNNPDDYGRRRAHALCQFIDPKFDLPEETQNSSYYEQFGVFINGSTLEIELYNAGCIEQMNSVIEALCDVAVAKSRFQKLLDQTKKENTVVELEDQKRFIKDIEYVGKGRFAQRLCAELCTLDTGYDICPPYILKAIRHVIR